MNVDSDVFNLRITKALNAQLGTVGCPATRGLLDLLAAVNDALGQLPAAFSTDGDDHYLEPTGSLKGDTAG